MIRQMDIEEVAAEMIELYKTNHVNSPMPFYDLVSILRSIVTQQVDRRRRITMKLVSRTNHSYYDDLPVMDWGHIYFNMIEPFMSLHTQMNLQQDVILPYLLLEDQKWKMSLTIKEKQFKSIDLSNLRKFTCNPTFLSDRIQTSSSKERRRSNDLDSMSNNYMISHPWSNGYARLKKAMAIQ